MADLLPRTSIEQWAAAAVLWMAPPWLCALWALWALLVGLRARLLVPCAAMAAVGLVGMGQPLPLRYPQPDASGLVVFTTNVNAFSPLDSPEDRAALEALLASKGADVVVVLEKRPLALPGYTRAADNFDRDLPRISHGTAVFCRDGIDCEAAITGEFGSETSVMPVGLARVQGPLAAPICIGALHAPPPVPKDWTGHVPHIEAIASHLRAGRLADAWGPCAAGDPMVLTGDLNAVPRSEGYRRLRDAGLRDPLQGVGVFGATWPGGGGWPNLPYFRLDHALVGPVGVDAVRIHTIPGADHRALRFVVTDDP